MAILAASYGWMNRYPSFPLFVAGIVMPVFGPGLVLVAVAIAGERHDQRPALATVATPRKE